MKMNQVQENKNISNPIHDELTLLKSRIQQLEKENEMQKIGIEELTTTNQHLISATWRERELKNELAQALEDLKQTKALVDAQNKKITESINYAFRIQKAILLNEQLLGSVIPESFILHKSKDKVSGDFPWMYISGDDVFVAAVDCTGHGVPGALMSVMGYFMLGNIVKNNPSLSPADVLNLLHATLMQTLTRNDPDAKIRDGMDIAICKWNVKTNRMEYSGAHRPLYLVRNDEVIQYAGDKMAIGGVQSIRKGGFSNAEVELMAGDALYLFSDGYPDQFGGPEGRKIGPKQLRSILAAPARHLSKKKLQLDDFFNNWLSDGKQIDDVLVIGIRPVPEQ